MRFVDATRWSRFYFRTVQRYTCKQIERHTHTRTQNRYTDFDIYADTIEPYIFSVSFTWEKKPTLFFRILRVAGYWNFQLNKNLKISNKKTMKFERWSLGVSLTVPLLLLLALNAVASNTDAISDDDLVERIKTNEFVVALFGEWILLEIIVSKKSSFLFWKLYLPEQWKRTVPIVINMKSNCIRFEMISRIRSPPMLSKWWTAKWFVCTIQRKSHPVYFSVMAYHCCMMDRSMAKTFSTISNATKHQPYENWPMTRLSIWHKHRLDQPLAIGLSCCK